MNATNKQNKGINKMNILELAPRKGTSGRTHSNAQLRYKWNKQSNNKTGGVALTFTVKLEVLRTAAYVKGDRLSVHLNDDGTGVFLIAADGDMALSFPAKASAISKLAYCGVENLQSIFPNNKNCDLKILGVSTGKIHFQMPIAD